MLLALQCPPHKHQAVTVVVDENSQQFQLALQAAQVLGLSRFHPPQIIRRHDAPTNVRHAERALASHFAFLAWPVRNVVGRDAVLVRDLNISFLDFRDWITCREVVVMTCGCTVSAEENDRERNPQDAGLRASHG